MSKTEEAAKLIFERRMPILKNGGKDRLIYLISCYIGEALINPRVPMIIDDEEIEELELEIRKNFPPDLAKEVMNYPCDVYIQYSKILMEELKKKNTFFGTYQLLVELDLFEIYTGKSLREEIGLTQEFENKAKVEFLLQLKDAMSKDEDKDFNKISEYVKALDILCKIPN